MEINIQDVKLENKTQYMGTKWTYHHWYNLSMSKWKRKVTSGKKQLLGNWK